MKTKNIFKSEVIVNNIENLPFFSIGDLVVFEKNKNYLKTLLFRLARRGKIIPLKKGYYVSGKYLDNLEKKNFFKEYLEFIAAVLYSPSYLSLEYVLSEYNILTEFSQNFTLITKNKTKKFKNKFGVFVYHHVKNGLFEGFNTVKKDNFFIFKATKAKALFDFLYLRKNILINKKTIAELRLNLNNFTKKDIAEFKKYMEIENSKRMKEVFISQFANAVPTLHRGG